MLAYTQTRSGLLFSPPFFFVNYATTLYRGRLQKMLACVQTRSGRRFAPTESLKSQCKGIFTTTESLKRQCKGIFTTTESLKRQCKGIFTIKSHYTQDFFLNFSILKSENRVMRIKKIAHAYTFSKVIRIPGRPGKECTVFREYLYHKTQDFFEY